MVKRTFNAACRRIPCWILLGGALSLSHAVQAQERNFAIVRPDETAEDIIRKAANVVPSPRQAAWQELEFITFIHFGMNTMTDREWGTGAEDPSMFNPTELDARRWVKSIRDAGMKQVILTAKHHDGFCLWPSKYTDHSVKRSPWRHGNGDVVREVADACHEYGLKFGVYLSPWDRHEPTYGDSPRYNEFFRNQLTELLSNYGDISEVWFDGACGEGPNGKRQEYDWKSYYAVIRKLQPKAVIFGMGPDVRWVGTEAGYARETEWSVLPDKARNLDSIAARSQQNPVDGAFIPGDLTGEDLGSRVRIAHATALVWYPAEADVSLRPGWFYHAAENGRAKSSEQLLDIYYNSVGRNAVLLLNLSPDKHGIIHEDDLRNVVAMREILDRTFKQNLVTGATCSATSEQKEHRVTAVIDGKPDSYWAAEDGTESASLEFTLRSACLFDRAMLQENIHVGQRIESFHLDAWDGSQWKQFAAGTTVGYKRLLRFPAVRASKVRLVIDRSRTNPTLSAVGLFKSPAAVVIEPDGDSFQDSTIVRLVADEPGVAIRYTLDGSDPLNTSPLYNEGAPLHLRHTTTVKAAAFDGSKGIVITAKTFVRSRAMRSISIEGTASTKYGGGERQRLIDGKRGSAGDLNKEWIGFEGENMTATVELADSCSLSSITLGCLQAQGSWVFLPSRVSFFSSPDGIRWDSLGTRPLPCEKDEEVCTRDIALAVPNIGARYVRVVAENVGRCPGWHAGAGKKAWLFVDEIIVEGK